MSTNIATARVRKAQAGAPDSDGILTVVCLLAVVGLALTALMAHFGFDAEIAAALATAG